MEGAGDELILSIGPPPARRFRTENENRESAIELDLSLSPPGDRRSEIDLELNLSLNGRYGTRESMDAAAKGKAPMFFPEEAPPISTGSDAAAKGKAPMVYEIGAQAMRGANLNEGLRLANLDGGQRLTNLVANLDGEQRLANLNGGQRLLTNSLHDMPYVTASAPMLNDGQIEGILYWYRMTEEFRIVCVCHGIFMSPAEFIKHGGGGDVDDPLKYISVSPFSVFRN